MNFVVTSKCRKLGGYPDTYSWNRIILEQKFRVKSKGFVSLVWVDASITGRFAFTPIIFIQMIPKRLEKWKTRGNRWGKRMAQELSLRPQTIFNVKRHKNIESCLIVFVESKRRRYLTYFGVQFSCNASTFPKLMNVDSAIFKKS